ncbi:RNA polymerase sigma factor [Virgibacillus sp. W0181]|uniref:RNA polymerase sigma factor n=1 Tax=Virgibacillus sp. W0181 TaxID=3391581 RepID=UPI003F487613
MLFDSERKWLKKIKKGDQQAFRKLYNAYADYALRTAYAITRNQNHAADIVQETFIKVYRNIGTFKIDQPFKPWFYKILLNESRRYMKKQNKQAMAMESEELLDYFNEKATNNKEKLHEDVQGVLSKLSETHRTVLVLKYMNGFTEQDIATLLELNVNTVKSRLYKARLKFKAVIGGGNNAKE